MTCILLVDDDRVFREIMAVELKAHGLHVLQAEDGRTALSTVLVRGVDVVLSDIQMPEMDGFQVLRQLKGIRPDLPIFLMTGNPLLAGLTPPGAVAVFEKPINITELVAAIHLALPPPRGG